MYKRQYLLGATEDVVRTAAAKLIEQHPSLSIAGLRNGYFRSEDEAGIVEDIARSGADCLFIGMPTPSKERFLAAYRDVLGTPFIMGVGGSFDVVAGYVSRAPARIQALGLEWLYRVYQEPRRMWWRYLKTNTVFAALLAREIARRSRPRIFGQHVSPR